MSQYSKSKAYFRILLATLILQACSSTQPKKTVEQVNNLPSTVQDSQGVDSIKVAEEGMKFLQAGDYDKARRLFSAAIKFDAANADLHLLLGMAYHLEFVKTGVDEAREKSLLGYQIAARYAPKDILPILQLGRLELDTHEYKEAAKVFAQAITINPTNGDALYGLATSSYLSGDLVTALWSADELGKLQWNAPAVNRLKTILFNAAGLKEQASESRAAYVKLAKTDPKEIASFDLRLEEIRSVIESQKWLTPPVDSSVKPLPEVAVNSSLPSNPTPEEIPPQPEANGAPQKPWYECTGIPAATTQQSSQSAGANAFGGIPGMGLNSMGNSSGYGGYGGFNSGSAAVPTNVGVISTNGAGEEISQLQALPTPCIGAPMPRMAVIDAVLLRTEVSDSQSYGVNLLQGLNLFFGRSTTRTSPESTVTTVNYGLGGAGISTALAYSLNIANATNNRNEVIARPSLLAIDRLPSTFFSGTTASIAVPSGVGGISSLTDKQYGISFSVTPTFVNDKHVLLSIKAVRSFAETPDAGTTGVSLSLSRNSVTANVLATFGDTIILSGLTERQLTRSDNGVPVLRDIPIAQYLFQNYRTSDFFRTVMIMVTLRRPITDQDQVVAANREKASRGKGAGQRKDYAFYWRIEEYEKFLNSYAPNLDLAIDTMETNELYKHFKSRDLIDVNWGAQPRLKQILNDLTNSIYRAR
jgi:general secretion pathway protein D